LNRTLVLRAGFTALVGRVGALRPRRRRPTVNDGLVVGAFVPGHCRLAVLVIHDRQRHHCGGRGTGGKLATEHRVRQKHSERNRRRAQRPCNHSPAQRQRHRRSVQRRCDARPARRRRQSYWSAARWHNGARMPHYGDKLSRQSEAPPSRSLRADTSRCHGVRAAPSQGDNGVTPATFQAGRKRVIPAPRNDPQTAQVELRNKEKN